MISHTDSVIFVIYLSLQEILGVFCSCYSLWRWNEIFFILNKISTSGDQSSQQSDLTQSMWGRTVNCITVATCTMSFASWSVDNKNLNCENFTIYNSSSDRLDLFNRNQSVKYWRYSFFFWCFLKVRKSYHFWINY